MHSSIAQAKVKGIFRNNEIVADMIMDEQRFVSSSLTRRNIGFCNAFMNEERAWYGDGWVSERKQSKRASKHYVMRYEAFEPELLFVEGVGYISRYLINELDTRKFVANRPGGFMKLISTFYIHEHFYRRAFQRIENNRIGDLRLYFGPIISSLLNGLIWPDALSHSMHFVFRDVVIVANKGPEEELIFKTMLLNERFTDTQSAFYGAAIRQLGSVRSLNFVFIDGVREVIGVHSSEKNAMSMTDIETTPWFRQMNCAASGFRYE